MPKHELNDFEKLDPLGNDIRRRPRHFAAADWLLGSSRVDARDG
jgi:hypothetical protein